MASSLFRSSEEIENITLQYPQALAIRFTELWLFPSIRFRTNGTIVGWRFASVETINGGGGRPRLSVWRPDPQVPDTYILRESRVMINCIVSEATLPSGEIIRFHVGGPTSDIMFSEGDIIGMLYRSSDISTFSPYLYDTSIVNPFGEPGSPPPLGYLLYTRTDSRTPLSVRGLSARTFLPILALDTCKFCNETFEWSPDRPTFSTYSY